MATESSLAMFAPYSALLLRAGHWQNLPVHRGMITRRLLAGEQQIVPCNPHACGVWHIVQDGTKCEPKPPSPDKQPAVIFLSNIFQRLSVRAILGEHWPDILAVRTEPLQQGSYKKTETDNSIEYCTLPSRSTITRFLPFDVIIFRSWFRKTKDGMPERERKFSKGQQQYDYIYLYNCNLFAAQQILLSKIQSAPCRGHAGNGGWVD